MIRTRQVRTQQSYRESDAPYTVGATSEGQLIDMLQRGDEGAFGALVDTYHGQFLHVAKQYVPCYAIAEEVVQETWLGIFQGIHRFQRQSSLKTWLFRILINRAISAGKRASRSYTFSDLSEVDTNGSEPTEDMPRRNSALIGSGVDSTQRRQTLPEDFLLGWELQKSIMQTIEALPPTQRTVITLRDLEGLSADEVCKALDLTQENQRVRLHRARAKVRRALNAY